MGDVNDALTADRSALGDLIAAAERSAAHWSTPRAAGKWSPSQIVEHVARALEESANVVAGAPSNFPTLPIFLRPIIRGLFFNRVLRKGEFPKSKAVKALDPISGPETPAEARPRLEAALARFDQACRARTATGKNVTSTVFGTVSVEDYARFQEVHIRHHCRQITGDA